MTSNASFINTFLLKERPSITITPNSGSIKVNVGDQLRIECTSGGDPPPLVSWERLGGYM